MAGTAEAVRKRVRRGAGSVRRGLAAGLAAGLAGTVLLLGGCSNVRPQVGQTPGATGSPGTATPGGTASPSPAGTASPGSTPGADQTPTPGTTPNGSPAPLTCTSVTPVRIQKLSTEPRRTTEVVSVVSDGRNITSGTREQTDFVTPRLEGPDGAVVDDEPTMTKIASLIGGSAKNVVLLTRPDPPDTGVDANKRPFNAPGTYVLFNASTPLVADVIVQCSGQEQRWAFTSESDPTKGQVNCAVEPPKTNAIARLVWTNNC